MKYFSPSFSYIRPPRNWATDYSWNLPPRSEVEPQIFRRILGVGEHDRPVVLVDHPAVVSGHVLLELGGVEEALLLAERLGDLVVVEIHPAGGVDPDHRGEVHDLDVVLGAHHLSDDRTDLVVHEGDPALVRRGVV